MKTIALILSILCAVQCWAATYYVATTGSDSNPGTVGSPFLTVSKAVSVAQAGDTVEIAAGLYSALANVMTTVRSGTSVAPITFRGAGPTTYIRSCNFYHDWIVVENVTSYGGWNFYNGSNNCTVQNSTSDPSPYSNLGSNVWCEGNSVTSTTANHTIRNCNLLNAKTSSRQAVQLKGTGHLIENCYITKTDNGPDCFWIWGTDHIIRGCTVENWDQVPYDPAIHMDIFQTFANNGESSKNILVEKCIFKNGQNTQIGFFTDDGFLNRIENWTFRNNIFINITADIQFYARNMKLYNNTFYKCGTQKPFPVAFRTSTDRGNGHYPTMYGNIFYKCGTASAQQLTYHGFYDLNDTDGGPAILLTPTIDNNHVIGVGAGLAKNGKWLGYRGVTFNAGGVNGVEPLFVNPNSATTVDDLRLLAGSPLIGQGQVLNASFTDDYSGATRGAAWDIGALEYDVGGIPADTTPPTLTSAVINSTGLQLTLNFSENVSGVNAAHYALSGGQTLGGVSTNGPVVTMTITPAVQAGATVTLAYTSGAGRTADAAGNLLETFGAEPVENNSLEPTPDPPKAPRKGRGVRAVMQGR